MYLMKGTVWKDTIMIPSEWYCIEGKNDKEPRICQYEGLLCRLDHLPKDQTYTRYQKKGERALVSFYQ